MDMTSLESHLNRVNELFVLLGQDPSNIVRDMLLQELRQCYDAALKLEHGVARPAAPAVKVKVVDPEPMPTPQVETPAMVAEIPATVEPEAVAVVETLVVEVAAPVFTEAPAQEMAAPARAVEPAHSTEPAVRTNAHMAVKAEKPNDDTILAGKLNRKPVSDLRSAIPLNEKFGIIRNLFGGNASDFGDAVLKLNNSRSPEELKHYFQLLTQRKGWDTENESYQIFLDYVERRSSSITASDANTDQ